MSLKDLALPTRTVTLSRAAGGVTVDLRGLSFADFGYLAEQHGPIMSGLFAELVAKGDEISTETVGLALKSLAMTAPTIAAQAIALAADELEMADRVVKLGMADQVTMLEAVFDLTFSSEAELKKLVEVVTRALTGLNTLTVIAKS